MTDQHAGLAAPVRIDYSGREAWRGDTPLKLTRREFDLLALLTREAGKVITREQIMREVWDTTWMGSTKSLDMHISLLRQRLGDSAQHPTYVTTVRGVGFRFNLAMLEAPAPTDPRTPLLILPLPVDMALLAAVMAAVEPAWRAQFGHPPTTDHVINHVTPWGPALLLMPPVAESGEADRG